MSVGDYVKEGADIVNLESIDPLKVDFRVPETYLRQVQVGQSLEVTLDALPGKTYDGKVIAINPLIDAAGRSIVIRAQVRNQDTALRPGMFARVRLITREREDAMVAARAGAGAAGRRAVRVQGRRRQGRAREGRDRASVATARSRSSRGLAPGDMVVTAGQLKLRDGVAVQRRRAATRPRRRRPRRRRRRRRASGCRESDRARRGRRPGEGRRRLGAAAEELTALSTPSEERA